MVDGFHRQQEGNNVRDIGFGNLAVNHKKYKIYC
jgi:uncharacterized protein YkvS